jgi:phosphate uptake regulator
MKRKIQQLSSSTVGVSIPAEWARAHDIVNGDQIAIEGAEGSDSLLLIPEETVADSTVAQITSDGLSEEILERTIVYQYLAGKERIHVERSQPLAVAEQTGIRSAEERLMGIDIVKQGPKHATFRCSLREADFSVRRLLDRLIRIEASMRTDALTALEDQNYTTSRTVEERYRQLEQVYFLYTRIVRKAQRDPQFRPRVGLDPTSPMTAFRMLGTGLTLLAERTRELWSLRESFEGQLLDSEVMEYVWEINEAIDDALTLSATTLKERQSNIVGEAQEAASEARSGVELLDEYIFRKRPEPLLMIDRLSVLLDQYVKHTLDRVVSAIGIASCDRTLETVDGIQSFDYLSALSSPLAVTETDSGRSSW